jgi:hypothetical protein
MSGARFNPPPSWPVPRGWDPPPNWQPDPSWAPAPAGWQFWVDTEADDVVPTEADDVVPTEADDVVPTEADDVLPTEADGSWEARNTRAPSRRRKHALIAGAVAVVVALVAGTVAVVNWFRDEPSSARPEAMLPGTYPTVPDIDWSIDVTDIGGGPEPAFTSPAYGAAYYATVGSVVVGDHAVVHVVPDRSSPDDAQMAAINLTDGRVEWTRPSNGRDGCSHHLVGDLLPCKSSENYGSTSQVDFIDINTGAVRSSASVPFYVNMLASDGADVYLAGYRESDGLVVSRGSVEDPTSAWQVGIPGRACDGFGGGDSYDLQVRDGIVSGFQGGGAEIALRASDGSPLFDYSVSAVKVHPGPIISARRCMTDVNSDEWPTEVADGSGTVLFTTDAVVAHLQLDVTAEPANVLVTTDGAGLDASTGETLWRQADWPDYLSDAAIVGDTLLYGDDQSDVIRATSLDSGSELWDESPGGLGRDSLTDGRNLISASQSEIQARSIDDGKVLWSKIVPGATDQDTVVLAAADQGLLYVTGRQIGLLRPTGPAVSVPGTADTEAVDEAGGTSLVTRCGTPPSFHPQEITTESGELVITMQIVAKCPGGDVLSSPRTSLAVTTADGQNVASAVFDLSTDAIVIAPDPGGSGGDPSVTHRFGFPPGTFWRLPVSLDEAPGAGATQKGRVDLDAETLLVDCQTDGGGDQSGQAGSGSEASTATGPAPPQRGDDESASFDALRAIANADRPFVTQQLADRWVPQLSSKRPGLVADGITWANASTLREHLDLRLKYPEVRLLWSGDWSVFSAPDFWVTIAGVTFPDAGGALAWCRNNGLDRDHCYAKLVSAHHPVEGSTAFNN